MNIFNQTYNSVESIYEWYAHARTHVSYQNERHYHRCERKRFNGKTFRHKTKYFYQRPYYIKKTVMKGQNGWRYDV